MRSVVALITHWSLSKSVWTLGTSGNHPSESVSNPFPNSSLLLGHHGALRSNPESKVRFCQIHQQLSKLLIFELLSKHFGQGSFSLQFIFLSLGSQLELTGAYLRVQELSEVARPSYR
jgi:hypothetical protein